MNSNISIKNRRASFEYILLDEFEAGIVLTGTEIKSLRNGHANINDAYCTFKGDELFVLNMHINEYSYGTYNNHDPKHDRKLLLNRKELKKMLDKVKEKGFTIVPINLFINEKGKAKLNIALAKGKHAYDKRESLKEIDIKREMQRKEHD